MLSVNFWVFNLCFFSLLSASNYKIIRFKSSVIFFSLHFWQTSYIYITNDSYESLTFTSVSLRLSLTWIFKLDQRWIYIFDLYLYKSWTCNGINFCLFQMLAVNLWSSRSWIFKMNFYKYSTCTKISLRFWTCPFLLAVSLTFIVVNLESLSSLAVNIFFYWPWIFNLNKPCWLWILNQNCSKLSTFVNVYRESLTFASLKNLRLLLLVVNY